MRLFSAALTGSAAAFLCAAVALAQPSIPATYYGSVTVDGQPAADGTDVRGFIGGIDCTQGEPGSRPVIPDGETTAYVVHIVHASQRPGCASAGAQVTFTVAGVPAVQQSQWRPGPIRLDLSTGAASPIPLPTATGTVEVIPTSASTSEAGTTSTSLPPPSGTPPTGDAQAGVTSSGSQSNSESEPADDGDGDGSAIPFLLIGLAILALAGGGAGVYLARRKRASAAPPPPGDT